METRAQAQTCLQLVHAPTENRSCTLQLSISTGASDDRVNNAVSELLGYGGASAEYVRGLLAFFDEDIKGIAWDILYSGGHGECAMLDIARRCYTQATVPDGVLHYDRYHDIHNHNQGQENWTSFWKATLLHTPGPILFNPHTNPIFQSYDFQLSKVPIYLFRTFDSKSFGLSNSSEITSPATLLGEPVCKFSIFNLCPHRAAEMVNRHMNPWRVKDYSAQKPDNFMSWTSSLLYAVQ